jgi:hypothetical protein
MFAAIRYYQADPPSVDEVVRRVQEGFVPLIRDTQGFVSYFLLIPSEREDEIVSVSVFEEGRRLGGTEPQRASPACPGVRRRGSRRVRGQVVAPQRSVTSSTTCSGSRSPLTQPGGGRLTRA